jgi:hypothetical protein
MARRKIKQKTRSEIDVNESLLFDLSKGKYPKPENYNPWMMLAASGQQIEQAREYLKVNGYIGTKRGDKKK